MYGNKNNLLLISFLAVGIGETIAQVVLTRELIVNFQGNELSLGVIFANWLILTAIGSGILGRYTDKIPKKFSFFPLTQILFFLILPLQILFARKINSLMGIEGIEMVSLPIIFFSSFLVLAPSCILNGFQFSLGCRLLSLNGNSSINIGRIYIAEAIGCVLGGFLFTFFLVYHFNPLQIAIIAGIINLFSSLLLIKIPSFSFLFIISLLGFSLYLLPSQYIIQLNKYSREWQWINQKLIYEEDSIYGNISITKINDQLNFYENGLLLFTSPYPDIAFNEELAHLSLLLHPSPRRVLLLGGGMGGVLKEISKHNVEIDYVELDPLIIELSSKFLPYKYDLKINFEITDARFFVKTKERKYDVIILNFPPPSTLQLNRFYTKEFFTEISKKLTSYGIFSLGLPASESYMDEEIVKLNRCIWETLKEIFPEVLVIPGDFCIFVSFLKKENIPSLEEISERFHRRNIKTNLLTLPYIYYKFSKERSLIFLKNLLKEEVKINKDTRPIATFYSLSLFNIISYPQSRSFFQRIQKIPWWYFLIIFLFPLLFLRRHTIAPVIFTIITTGFFGFTFNILLIFSFQILLGYLYHKIGILVSSFMLGLALGGYCMTSKIEKIRRKYDTLMKIEILITSYSFILLFIILLLFTYTLKLSFILESLLYILNLSIGFLVGLQFPLASSIYLEKEKRVGRLAGILYASDLLGAVLGALLIAPFFIPLFGIITTVFFILFAKIMSLSFLKIWRKISL